MPSKVWSGSISFGLVNVPVGLYSATADHDVHFHRYHIEDGGRVRQKRICEVDGQQLELEDIARGYELPSGDMVVMTDQDFEGLPLPTLNAISVEAFVPAEQIDPIMYSGSYYLAPDKAGVRAYALLRDAIASADKIAVVKIAIRDRERLAALRVRDKVIVLEVMLWPDEIREAVDIPSDHATKAELDRAKVLIEEMSADFDPGLYTDQYQQALHEVIEAKKEGKEVVRPAAPKAEEGGGKVVDLMAALKASVEAAKSSRAEPAEKAAAHPPARKKATKKTAARKSA